MHQVATKIKKSLLQALDRLEQKIFAGARKQARVKQKLPQVSWRNVLVNRMQSILVLASGGSFLAAFYFAFSFYSTTIQRIDEHPLVSNLTSAGINARIKVGASGVCDGGVECWLLSDFDDSQWMETRIPFTGINNVPGFRQATAEDRVYYRFDIPIDSELLKSDFEVSFTPLYVNHRRFQAYVDGNLVAADGGPSNTGHIVNIPIYRDQIEDGRVKVTLRTSAAPGDFGISHNRSMYVGPKNVLDQVYVLQERSNSTYFLLFLLSKGSVFIVFTLFFYFTVERRALFSFMVYAFFVTIEHTPQGNFLSEYVSLNQRIFLFYLFKSIGLLALGKFFLEYFQAFRARKLYRVLSFVFLVVMTGIVFDATLGSKTIAVGLLPKLTNYSLLAVLAVGITLGLLAIRMWRRFDDHDARIRSFQSFTFAITIYLVLMTWETFFTAFVGFDKRSIFDLMFFFFIAFVTAKEFGFNQGQVQTLEKHMEEKRRMEAELREAGEIAKVFLPGKTPNIDFCKVDVFHRSFSESSGDWYTFEQSSDGRLFHTLMCDITGHGVQAAIVVSTCRTVLSAMIQENSLVLEQKDFVLKYAERLNKILFKQGNGQHVTTLLGLTIDREDLSVQCMAAGHPSPLVVNRHQELLKIRPINARNTVVGAFEDTKFVLHSTKLDSGEELLAFTDGMPIGRNVRSLKEVLRQPDITSKELFDAVWRSERVDSEPDDDVSIIWLKVAS